MDFSFTEEQVLLRNSVQRFIQDRYSFEARKAILASEAGWSRDNWRAFAELGLLAAPFAEEYGGFGGGAVETMIIMEEFGKGLVVEPYLQTVVLCGGLINLAGSSGAKIGLSAENRQRGTDHGAGLCGTAGAFQSCRSSHPCRKKRRWFCAEWRKGGGQRRALGG